MKPTSSKAEQLGTVWLDFWFIPPPAANLTLLRILTGTMLIFVLIVRSYDLEAQFSQSMLGNPEILKNFGDMAWSFSIFNWIDSTIWLWTVHLFAITLALAFALGIFPSITGLLALVFNLSYAHNNPSLMLGLDGLLNLSLIYLVFSPTGKQLTLLWWLNPPPPTLISTIHDPQEPPLPWGGIASRVLQIHLCLIYFQSGLVKLNTGWLEGMALWHPTLVEKGGGLSAEVLQAYPELLTLLPFTIALFELFYGVFIWLRRFRYPTLLMVVVFHLLVGILWEKLPFNLMMIALNLIFVPTHHLEKLGASVLRGLNLSLNLVRYGR